jgi:glyoxylase-like metal-dependent hydrolase (beta-lactamase superfamily II)
MTVSNFTIGTASIERIVESEEPLLDPFELYPDATPEAIARQQRWLAPRFYDPASRLLVIAIQGFVVRSGGKVIVVDTCVGDCKKRRRSQFDGRDWGWLTRLGQGGVRPEDVDYVVCTHFHVDHVGWNTRLAGGRWVPTFPNARYLFVREEWDFWLSERGMPGRSRTGDYVEDSVLPVAEAGLVDFVSADHRIDGSVSLAPAPGHTPGLTVVHIRSAGNEAVLASDVLHSPLQLAYPHWSTSFCADREQSRRTRLALLERWAGSGTLILPAHFPAPSAGRVHHQDDAYRFVFIQEAA